MSVSETVRQFLNGIRSRHTRRAYRTDLRNFFEHMKDEDSNANQIESVTKADIREYIRFQYRDGLSVSTRERRLAALRRFFDWAVDRGLSNANPARDAQIDGDLKSSEMERSSEAPSVLSKSETETLVYATNEAGEAATRDRALILTILYAALRRAEVAAMDVDHVRPLGRHWVIDLSSEETWSSGYVKIPETLVEAIDSVQARYDIDQGALWRSLSNRNRGARMTPDAIYKLVRRTADRAGLADITVDTLRQTGMHLALKAGATLRQVQLHSRLQSAGSVERYSGADGQSGRLSETAMDFLDLDVVE